MLQSARTAQNALFLCFYDNILGKYYARRFIPSTCWHPTRLERKSVNQLFYTCLPCLRKISDFFFIIYCPLSFMIKACIAYLLLNAQRRRNAESNSEKKKSSEEISIEVNVDFKSTFFQVFNLHSKSFCRAFLVLSTQFM